MTLQQSGDIAESDRVLAAVSDPTAVGAVLAARYLSPSYHASAADLENWWASYAAEPEAVDIYALMQHRLKRADLPAPPSFAMLPEQTLTAGAAAHAVYSPDNSEWHQQFLSGLAAWQHGNLTAAAGIFATTAQIPGISDDDRAASQFWAARAALRQQQPSQYLDWLHQASWSAGTFYGMLAGRLLGQGFTSTGISASLTETDITAVDSIPQGHLAFVLLQLGLNDSAAEALRAMWPQMQATPGLSQAVMAVAARAGLIDVAIGTASTLPAPVNEIAGARLPLPALHPEGGFTVNPALVYALARTESGFDSRAISRCGARGLMQLMPTTASVMRRQNGISGPLSDPSANLALGQAYLRYLGEQPGINNNLLAVLASYNAGPGSASAWYSTLQKNSDPLYFIETIPNTQTRRFVRQVLADSWIYAEEIGLQPKSLDAIAQGDMPTLLSSNYALASN
ncbi:lytic transglycosylase domain-containing protein [Acidocella sp.]|uniref:lytic transglycosylase domain-containing protein n=1 Tax=Acidocella sp. TaxID=50710 RepID=UPI00260B4CCF|nr:lytic transglycosylase domain-containing protein [Acidocella sp.]